jgi:hypothetical protein
LECKKQLYPFVQAFPLLALPLDLIKKAAAVSRFWRQAAQFCLYHLRQLQYRLPLYNFTEDEQALIWASRKFWVGHSTWMMKLLKATDWTDESAAKEAVSLLDASTREQPYSHVYNMCGQLCHGKLPCRPSAADALELLSGAQHNRQVRAFAVNQLRHAPSDEVGVYIPALVHDLRFEPRPAARSPLADLLIDWAKQNAEWRSDLFWCSYWAGEGKRFKSTYRTFLNRMLVTLDETVHNDLFTSQYAVYAFEQVPNGASKRTIERVLREEFSCLEGQVTLPVWPTVPLTSIDMDSINVFSSATAPFAINMQMQDTDQVTQLHTQSFTGV